MLYFRSVIRPRKVQVFSAKCILRISIQKTGSIIGKMPKSLERHTLVVSETHVTRCQHA